jgi:CRP-like cAMP-binding protein
VRAQVRGQIVTQRDDSTYLAKSLIDPAKRADLTFRLTESEKLRVESAGIRRSVEIGREVFTQGQSHQGILIILEGEVRSFYVAPSGREITLAYWSAGHFVGGPEIFGGGKHIWSGEATRKCELLFLPSEALHGLILSIPQFALNVIEGLVFKATCFSSLLQFVGTQPASKTLAHLLLIIAGHQPSSDDGPRAIDRRYSQEELAKMIGATRQWVAASLSRMKRSDLVSVVDGSIVIPSLSRLQRFAQTS